MPTINQALIERLEKTLNIGQAAVYSRIKKASIKYRLPRRDLAALVLAWENEISIQKYADAEQIDRLGGLTSPAHEAVATALPPIPSRMGPKSKPRNANKAKDNTVFVVHGRDEPLRKSMFAFLRSLGLKPMEWSHAVNEAKGGNPYVGHIIEAAMAKVQAVVVLLSPDEIAYLKDQFWGSGDRTGEGKPEGQPRPNVLFEAGLALGAHPDKTVLVQVGKVRAFSDIAGKHLVRLSNEPSKRNELANRLEKLGCKVVATEPKRVRSRA